ncbi:conjugative transfer protein MobI(A/C) [Shewanella algae]|uniref:conjugative transfer protein MobI(A/C) n=1 Tax=Shewanella algae TaxID=38313 RepID=UPI003BA96B3E
MHIPKGPSSRYRPSSFSKAQDWEKVKINYAEDAFQLLREIRHEMDNIRKKLKCVSVVLSNCELILS